MIVDVIKEYERRTHEDSIQQRDLIDAVAKRLELESDDRDTSE
jgi:hypothetical protein